MECKAVEKKFVDTISKETYHLHEDFHVLDIGRQVEKRAWHVVLNFGSFASLRFVPWNRYQKSIDYTSGGGRGKLCSPADKRQLALTDPWKLFCQWKISAADSHIAFSRCVICQLIIRDLL